MDDVETLKLVLPPDDSPLGRLVREQLRTLKSRRVTKSSLKAWTTHFGQEIWKNHHTISGAAESLSSSISLDARVIGAEAVCERFIEAVYLDATGQIDELHGLLEGVQLNVLPYLYGDDDEPVRQVQHTVVDEVVGDTLADDGDRSEVSTPRQAEDVTLPDSGESMSFEQFSDLLDPQRWEDELSNNPKLWLPLCKSWADSLNAAFEKREVRESLFNSRYRAGGNRMPRILCAGHLRTTCHEESAEQNVPFSYLDSGSEGKWYTKANSAYRFTEKRQTSGLAKAALGWSDRRAVALWRSPFAIKLFRLNRINITLLVVLTNWVPRQFPLREEQIPSFRWVVQPGRPSRTGAIEHGRDVIRALVKHPEIIPLDASPSSAYLFLSNENFVEAWEDFVLFGLQAKGYDVSPLYDKHGQLNSELFRQVSRAIPDRLLPRNRGSVKDERLLVILERSDEYLKLKKKLAPKGLGGLTGRADRQNLTAPCNICRHLEPSQQCVQDLLISVKPPNPDLIGCGVSAFPLKEVVDLNDKKLKGKDVKSLFHPIDDLGLREIRCNEDIVQRCGVQIFRILDRDTPGPNHSLRDFWMYNAFDKETFNSLSQHVRRFGNHKGLVRGRQFDTFTQGKMCPFGERSPKGGAPGDCHRLYDSMSAATPDMVHCLFDNADDSLVFSILTREVAPDIHAQIAEACGAGEKVGSARSTSFYCKNYTAPLHQDDDVGPGLCATLDFDAEAYEYCFINMAYPFYFAPRAGSLWSFRSSDIHGTSLPALRLRGGGAVRVSCTKHKAKPRKNARTAARYRQVRSMQSSVEEFWNQEP
ncbi:hypothetical protein NMY22_g12282 [Coprinellus aureogranulatus]|nr:hypothetical protein NMY22_g12282 [Coprinellus aureogranulatus]